VKKKSLIACEIKQVWMFFCAWNSCSSIESKRAIYKWRCPFFAWTSNITVVSVKIAIAKKTKQSNKICHLSASVMVWDHSTGQYSKKHVLFFSCEWNIMNLIYSIRLILNHSKSLVRSQNDHNQMKI
jgi:hypothetical protein